MIRNTFKMKLPSERTLLRVVKEQKINSEFLNSIYDTLNKVCIHCWTGVSQ